MNASSMIPALLLLCSAELVLLECEAQDETFTLNGVVKDQDSHALLGGTTITAMDTLGKVASDRIVSIRADKRGRYKLSLPYDHIYRVEYWAQAHVAKRVIIDLTQTKAKHREGGNTMTLEISLLAMIAHVDYSAYLVPVAVCRFDRDEKKFKWDMAYHQDRKGELDQIKKEQLAERRSKAAGH